MPAGDLPLLADVFRLGVIRDVRFIAEGLMNRNWRITAGCGVFALKQIIDVPLPDARRNLAVVTALTSDGMPVCPAVVTASGDTVAEAGGRGYCLFPWIDGCHLHGTELVLGQARNLGALLGRIHESGPATARKYRPRSPHSPRNRTALDARAHWRRGHGRTGRPHRAGMPGGLTRLCRGRR